VAKIDRSSSSRIIGLTGKVMKVFGGCLKKSVLVEVAILDLCVKSWQSSPLLACLHTT